MRRRRYLAVTASGGLAVSAGCLGGLSGSDRTVLDPPEQPRGDPIHPVHGDQMPAFSLSDPLTGTTVTGASLEGQTYLQTFFYTSCPYVCPLLLRPLDVVQEDAAERGYAGDIALLAMTFDPARDTPDRLRAYAQQRDIDLEAGNWHFLRPPPNERAANTLEETFGVLISREDGAEPDHTHTESTNDTNETTEHYHEGYTFTHTNLTLLVNDEGIVERAYPKPIPPAGTNRVVKAVRTVVEG